MHDSGWTYLSEEFIEDLERAIAEGKTIVSVLQEYGINRGTYYSWLAIGEGRMTEWRDGTPISEDMQTNCRRLAKRVLRARETRFRAKRRSLRYGGCDEHRLCAAVAGRVPYRSREPRCASARLTND